MMTVQEHRVPIIKNVYDKIFRALSDETSELLFKVIASNGGYNKVELTTQVANITTKQYYTRIEKLVKAGLIRRVKEKYVLTPFGRVIYQVTQAIEQTASLKTVFYILEESRNDKNIPREELDAIAKTLITNDRIRELAFP
jgi:predicted transcriptional regulator